MDGHASQEPDPPAGAFSAQDWWTIWQSELTALAADREGHELWAVGVAQWTGLVAGQWASLVRSDLVKPDLVRPGDDGPDGRAGAAAPPGAAAAPVPPVDVHALERRIADLERRLAAAGG